MKRLLIGLVIMVILYLGYKVRYKNIHNSEYEQTHNAHEHLKFHDSFTQNLRSKKDRKLKKLSEYSTKQKLKRWDFVSRKYYLDFLFQENWKHESRMSKLRFPLRSLSRFIRISLVELWRLTSNWQKNHHSSAWTSEIRKFRFIHDFNSVSIYAECFFLQNRWLFQNQDANRFH